MHAESKLKCLKAESRKGTLRGGKGEWKHFHGPHRGPLKQISRALPMTKYANCSEANVSDSQIMPQATLNAQVAHLAKHKQIEHTHIYTIYHIYIHMHMCLHTETKRNYEISMCYNKSSRAETQKPNQRAKQVSGATLARLLRCCSAQAQRHHLCRQPRNRLPAGKAWTTTK